MFLNKTNQVLGSFLLSHPKWADTTKILLTLTISLLFALFLYGVNLKAQWWIIDDHEIVHFLGSTGKLYPSEIFGKLMNETEIGMYGKFSRFRPAYFFLRLVECVLWGGRPALWYGFRIAIFALFVFAFWFISSKLIGYIFGGLITFHMATYSYWPDIIARLGPSELYAVLGLALFGLGIYDIYRRQKFEIGWLTLCSGYLICSGSKENFILFLLPTLIIFYDLYRKSKLKFVIWLGMTVVLIWTTWIAGAVLLYQIRNAHDPYYQPTNVAERSLILINSLKQIQTLILLGSALLFALISFRASKSNSEISKLSATMSKGFGGAFILYSSQIVFYNGIWPNGQRYDFPGLLIWPVLLVMFAWYFQELIPLVNWPIHRLYTKGLILAVVCAPVFFTFNGVTYAQTESNKNVARSSSFSEKINQIVDIADQNPKDPILIQTDKPDWDYEPVESYMDFLRYKGIDRPISFVWAGKPPSSYKGSKAIMAKDLMDLSLQGTALRLPVTSTEFTPLLKIKIRGENCISIVISGSPKINCSISIDGSWR